MSNEALWLPGNTMGKPCQGVYKVHVVNGRGSCFPTESTRGWRVDIPRGTAPSARGKMVGRAFTFGREMILGWNVEGGGNQLEREREAAEGGR